MEDRRLEDDRKFHRLAKTSDLLEAFMLFMIFMLPLTFAAMLTGVAVNSLFGWINGQHEMSLLAILFSLGIGCSVAILILLLLGRTDSPLGVVLISFILALFGSLMSNIVTFYAVNIEEHTYGEVLMTQLVWFGGATLAIVLLIVLAILVNGAVENALSRELDRRYSKRKSESA